MRPPDDLPIGIFDSGLGGLTVAAEVAAAMPAESVHYFGDTARCPYGPRPLDEVRSFALQIGAWLTARPVKILVIGCNTATAAGLEAVQLAFDVPVIGVVEPGARAAVRATRNGRVGVIGTLGTIESGAYSRAVHAIDAGVTVFSVATPKFVDIVEAGLRTGALRGTGQLVHDYLASLKRDAGIDTLILGCTHFPLLSDTIQGFLGPRIRVISSAEETAREVRETLDARGWAAPAGRRPRHRFATTGDPEEFRRLGAGVWRHPVTEVESVGLEELKALGPPPAASEG